jgi:DNA polymerase beta
LLPISFHLIKYPVAWLPASTFSISLYLALQSKLLQQLKKIMSSSSNNVNALICSILMQMANIEDAMGQRFKSRAYMKAIDSISQLRSPLKSGADAKRLDGVGAKIALKISEIIETGALESLERRIRDPKVIAARELGAIHGCGAITVDHWMKQGIMGLNDLRKAIDEGTVSLNAQQEIGLEFYDDLNLRIPRAEVAAIGDAVSAALKAKDERWVATVAGSFRRGNETCGDVDMLISHPDYRQGGAMQKDRKFRLRTIADELEDAEVLHEELSCGGTKYMGLAMLPGGTVRRRIDLHLVLHGECPFGLLYFTGSGLLNVQMRQRAIERGLTLNERCLTDKAGKRFEARSEQEIFELLGLTYLEPGERDALSY